VQKPSIGRTVHYVSYGTPGGEFGKECRAAIVTAVKDEQTVSLCVLNPTGQFFTQDLPYHDGAEVPGDPNCPNDHAAGPHHYCACGWMEASYSGGTWHWPERVE
jgi:hypothetical protein